MTVNSNYRAASVVVCLALLAGLLTTVWIVRGWTNTSGQLPTDRLSIFEEELPGAVDYETASQEELIQLAEAEIASLLDEFPDSPAAINAKANMEYLLSDTLAAEASWKKSLSVDRYNPDALFGLANIAFQAADYDKTITLCEGLNRTNPGNPRVPLLLADAFLNSGQADLAILTLEQHILTEPTSVQALAMLGTAQLNSGNFAQAISWFDTALRYAPDSKDAYYGLGQAYMRQGDREKAAEAMQRFSKLAETSGQDNASQAQSFEDRQQAAHVAAQVFVDSALVYKSAKLWPEARERLLRAQRLQPDVKAWLEELQRVLQSSGDLHAAADVGQRLVELSPTEVGYWLTLGGLYADLEQPEPAIEAFRKAIKLAPEHPDCLAAKSIIEQLN